MIEAGKAVWQLLTVAFFVLFVDVAKVLNRGLVYAHGLVTSQVSSATTLGTSF